MARTTESTTQFEAFHPIVSELIGPDTSVSEAMDKLLRFAVDKQANDIYCSAQRDSYMLSIRCEGAIHKLGVVPAEWGERLIAHAKVSAGLEPSEHRRPQDGRISTGTRQREVDLRLSVLPTLYGQDMALRVMAPMFRMMDLEELGMPDEAAQVVESTLRQPHGLILVTGPTGTGKTTTLYAMLRQINDGIRKINTIEDPVESGLPGIHQTEVNPRIDLDFADILPAVLRQDPDVIMLGEVRDQETATTAIRAAVTGQLVLATLHAPQSASAIFRMLGLGARRTVLAASLQIVIAQSLLRRICEQCAQPDENEEISFEDVEHLLVEGSTPSPRRGRGCDACLGSGYSGRLPLFEVMRGTPRIHDLIRKGTSPGRLESVAIEEGMIPLRTRAKLAVASGLTTLDEAERMIGFEHQP